MALYVTVLWLYAVIASMVFGAAVYETLVVHPAWSRKPPESFVGFVGVPISRMNIAAFWIPVLPLFALSALGALATAFWVGVQGSPIILSSTCAVAATAWTLAYFRPTIVDSAQLGPIGDGRGLLVGPSCGVGGPQMSARERRGLLVRVEGNKLIFKTNPPARDPNTGEMTTRNVILEREP
jgi:hypothetical protein